VFDPSYAITKWGAPLIFTLDGLSGELHASAALLIEQEGE